MKLHMIELKYEEVGAQVGQSTVVGQHAGGGQSAVAAEYAGGGRSDRGGQYKYKVTGKTMHEQWREGEFLEFKSDYGYINVKLPEDMFEPHLFSTDPYFCKQHKLEIGAPVKIKKLGPFKYCCGFAIGFPNTDDLGVEDPGH